MIQQQERGRSVGIHIHLIIKQNSLNLSMTNDSQLSALAADSIEQRVAYDSASGVELLSIRSTVVPVIYLVDDSFKEFISNVSSCNMGHQFTKSTVVVVEFHDLLATPRLSRR